MTVYKHNIARIATRKTNDPYTIPIANDIVNKKITRGSYNNLDTFMVSPMKNML
jgi:hypothetical protein